MNKAGPGEPSDPTGNVVAKPRLCKQIIILKYSILLGHAQANNFCHYSTVKPKLNLSALSDIRVRAGTPIKITVPFEGEPQPTVTWKKADSSLSSTPAHEIEIRENLTIFYIPKSERIDSGQYSIHLKNELGEDKGSLKVTVLDAPSEPQGPIKISDIHKEGCTLDWKPPVDDGGSEILHYVIEKLDTTRGTWQEVCAHVLYVLSSWWLVMRVMALYLRVQVLMRLYKRRFSRLKSISLRILISHVGCRQDFYANSCNIRPVAAIMFV